MRWQWQATDCVLHVCLGGLIQVLCLQVSHNGFTALNMLVCLSVQLMHIQHHHLIHSHVQQHMHPA